MTSHFRLVSTAAILVCSGALALPPEGAYTIGFSTTSDGSLLIAPSGTKRFPMAGYRRSFASAAQFAQFLINDLNGTPVYNTAGALVAVQGSVVTQGRSFYYDRSGAKVYVSDPILAYIGGTTGTVVVGSALLTLQASTQAAAVTAVSPAPTENVWASAAPPSSSVASFSLRGMQLPVGNSLIGCSLPVPTCRTPDGRPGRPMCVDGEWTGCTPITQPTVTVTMFPGSMTLPLGVAGNFTAGTTGTYNYDVTWSTTGGSASGYVNGAIRGAYYTPSSPVGNTLTATSVADPTKSARATITVPSAPNWSDPGGYSNYSRRCVPGDNGTQACIDGFSFSSNWWVYKDRGGRTEYVVCGSAPDSPSTCRNPDALAGITVSVNPFYYYHYSPLNQTRYAGTRPTQFGNTRVESKEWRVWVVVNVSDQGTISPGTGGPVHGVDDLAGECTTHGGVGNLRTRTAEPEYLPFCGTSP